MCGALGVNKQGDDVAWQIVQLKVIEIVRKPFEGDQQDGIQQIVCVTINISF